jgi:hypothetical protein
VTVAAKLGSDPASDRPEAAAGSVEHSKIADGHGDDPLRGNAGGKVVLCPLDSFTIEHGSEHSSRCDSDDYRLDRQQFGSGCKQEGTEAEVRRAAVGVVKLAWWAASTATAALVQRVAERKCA